MRISYLVHKKSISIEASCSGNGRAYREISKLWSMIFLLRSSIGRGPHPIKAMRSFDHCSYSNLAPLSLLSHKQSIDALLKFDYMHCNIEMDQPVYL